MRSWKTTVSGVVSSAAAFVLTLSSGGVATPKWLVIAAGFVMAGGLAALGVMGKDYNVSGTEPPPASKDVATK